MKKIILIFSFFILCGQNLSAQVLGDATANFENCRLIPKEKILGNRKSVSELSTQEVRNKFEFIMNLDEQKTLENLLLFSKIINVRLRRYYLSKGHFFPLLKTPFGERLTIADRFAVIEDFNGRLGNAPQSQKELFANIYGTHIFWAYNDIVIFPGLSQETQDELKIMTFLRDYFLDGNLQISGTDDDWLKTVFAGTPSLRVHLLAKAVLILVGTPLSEIEKLEANSQKFVPAEAGSLEELYSLWLDALVEAKNGNAISENLRSRIAKILEARPAFFVFPIIVESFANDEKWSDAAYFQYLQLREMPYWAHSKSEKLWQNFYNMFKYFENDNDYSNFFICEGFWAMLQKFHKNNPLADKVFSCETMQKMCKLAEANGISDDEAEQILLNGFEMGKFRYFENMDFENRQFKNSNAEAFLRSILESVLANSETFEKVKEIIKKYEIENVE